MAVCKFNDLYNSHKENRSFSCGNFGSLAKPCGNNFKENKENPCLCRMLLKRVDVDVNVEFIFSVFRGFLLNEAACMTQVFTGELKNLPC